MVIGLINLKRKESVLMDLSCSSDLKALILMEGRLVLSAGR